MAEPARAGRAGPGRAGQGRAGQGSAGAGLLFLLHRALFHSSGVVGVGSYMNEKL